MNSGRVAAVAGVMFLCLGLVGCREPNGTQTRVVATTGMIADLARNVGGDRGAKIDRKEFETALSRKVEYVLPEDSKSLSAANRAGRTVVDVAAGSKIAATLRDICLDLVGAPEAEGGAAPKKRASFTLFRRKKNA